MAVVVNGDFIVVDVLSNLLVYNQQGKLGNVFMTKLVRTAKYKNWPIPALPIRYNKVVHIGNGGKTLCGFIITGYDLVWKKNKRDMSILLSEPQFICKLCKKRGKV